MKKKEHIREQISKYRSKKLSERNAAPEKHFYRFFSKTIIFISRLLWIFSQRAAAVVSTEKWPASHEAT